MNRGFHFDACRLLACLLLLVLSARSAGAAEPTAGEKIYQAKCASCHGAAGQGSEDEYPDPLIGDLAVPQLADLIAKTMPKDKAGDCVADDAQAVAAYIFDAFYSPDAQIRNRPPRIELTHLTVRQYRHSVADLIGSFREPMKWGSERGLKAEYFKSKNPGKDRVIERIDPVVQFDYGEKSPDEKIDAKEFSMRWQGSFLAPETGEYEFIVRTDNAARLWVNDTNKTLIDRWVKSGDETEHRESIWLLGGRVYPLKLEYSKGKEKTASIGLWWKLPRREAEVIPARYLSTDRAPTTLVVQTPFPPDDRSVGYERGSSISKAWDQATTDAALEVAGAVAAQISELARTKSSDKVYEQRLREFTRRFAERAFRRPLTDDEKQLYLERQFQDAASPDVALKRVVLLVLKSPRFLYPTADFGAQRNYDAAALLALGLWDSIPDQTLLDAASRGELKTREQLVKQAERMSRDIRTQSKLRDFLVQWLRVDQVTDLGKDPAKFADFNQSLAADLRTSLDLSIDELVSSDAADYRQLLLADSLYLNGRLAKFYGADLPADATFQKIALEPEHRSGLLTHPYMLAGFAYTATSSPIHRGVFISRSILGRALRPPPEAVTPLAPDLHADLTTRERVALQTKSETCMACHAMINPLGFTLENFDAVGRYRKEEQGKPVDAAGLYATRAGELVKFNGVRELAAFLANSEEAHNAICQQLFQYTIKQPPQAYGPQTLPTLRESLAKNDFNLRQLMVDIVVQAAQH